MSEPIHLPALDGSTVSFEDRIIGSGQKKDCYPSSDGQYVVLWYREALSELEFSRLQDIVGRYRQQLFSGAAAGYWSELMCWPDRIVRYKERVGITAPRYGNGFFFEHGSKDGDALKLRGKEKEGYWFASLRHRARTLDPRELGDWRAALRVALRISRALRRLHAAGLVHGDLSYKNVLLDPPRGNACLIDLDGLVVQGKYPPDVIGTPDFIAPEVVATRHLQRTDPLRQLPSWHTDLHALAVLNYLLLLLRHPLRGDQIHDLDDDERQESLQMGQQALFVEDPLRPENRIQPQLLEGYEQPWKLTAQLPYRILGSELAPLVERAFVEGLHQPAQRPTAQEWEDALVRTADIIHPCSNTSCPAGWFVFDSQRFACPFCSTRVSTPVHVAHGFERRGADTFVPTGRVRILHHHAAIHAWHLRSDVVPNELTSPENAARLGYVALQGSQAWLVNEAIEDLQLLPQRKRVGPGEPMLLERGQQWLVSGAEPAHLWWIDRLEPGAA
jgi:hypothetical protein